MGDDGSGKAALPWAQRRLLLLLGVPAMGLAYTVTVVSTYVPVLVERFSGPVVVGLLVGGEGFFGIFMPTLVGTLSDRTSRSVKHRLLLLAGCVAVVGAAVVAIGLFGLLRSETLWGLGTAMAVLYIGYYSSLAPYWALYPDLVPAEQSGRARSAESSWRVTGVGLALVGGGMLLDVSQGLPFFAAAALLVVAVGTLAIGLRGRRHVSVGAGGSTLKHSVAVMRDLLRDRQILLLVVANGLWNFALAALRAFVVLFFTVGLERSTTFVATVIFPAVAVGIAVAAPLSGWLADRVGHIRVLTVALTVYGTMTAVPGVFTGTWVIVLVPLVAAGAATVMTLPFSVLMRLLPEEHHGVASGLFGLSRGVGGTLGPVVAGVAIVLLDPVLADTQGYGAVWFICSAALLASLPLLRGLRGDSRT